MDHVKKFKEFKDDYASKVLSLVKEVIKEELDIAYDIYDMCLEFEEFEPSVNLSLYNDSDVESCIFIDDKFKLDIDTIFDQSIIEVLTSPGSVNFWYNINFTTPRVKSRNVSGEYLKKVNSAVEKLEKRIKSAYPHLSSFSTPFVHENEYLKTSITFHSKREL